MSVKKLKVTTLVDNAVNSGGLLAEWGLSLLIETDQLNILFDCASTPTPFFHNINYLGVDLSVIDKILLSHGHNDHTGSLDSIIKVIPKKPDIVSGCGGWHPRFYEESWAGITHNKDYIQSLGGQLHEINETTRFTDDIVVMVNVPMESGFESIDDNLYAKKDGQLVQDDFGDELALSIKTDAGIVVFTGCAHRGIVNIVEHAKASTKCERVRAVIGGSHLMNANDSRIKKTIAYFKDMGVETIALSHCTGDKAAVAFGTAFKDSFIFNKAGLVIDLLKDDIL